VEIDGREGERERRRKREKRGGDNLRILGPRDLGAQMS
jgi:hypothetical protein